MRAGLEADGVRRTSSRRVGCHHTPAQAQEVTMNRCASSVRSALARPASRAVRTAFSRPAAISSSPFLRSAFSATARPQSVPVCRCFSSTPSRLGNEPGKYKIGQLSDREYHDVSNAAMDHLTEYLEEKLDELDVDGSDVEYSSGVLTVKLGDRGTYVINKQPPNKQIWLSSPIRGLLTPVPFGRADDVLESLRTATQLSLADLRDLQALASSSPRYGSSEDEQLAYNLWKEELERFTVTLADRQVAQDLQTALRTSQTLEAVRRQREQRSARLAAAAHPYRRKTPDSASTSASKTVPSTGPLASTSGALGHAPELVSSTPYCISCADEVDGDAAKATCGHLFCHPCLVRLFRLATRDESLFPPSCCKTPIPSTLAIPLLNAQEGEAYKRAVEEYSTPRRLYCSNGNTTRKSLAQTTWTETPRSSLLLKSTAFAAQSAIESSSGMVVARMCA
ncbi:Frataxin, mitochondrial [Rhodotorula toruloides]|nr:Frataxin, mitochondrial [Rhodotorula toruloides]